MSTIPKISLLFVFLMLMLSACESEKETPQAFILSTENLPKTTFQFSTDRDTILIAKEGTIFHIPANAFVDKNDEVYKGVVEIELLEAFSLEDMVLGNLTTVSDDGRWLESSGMFRFSIKGKGKILKVNPKSKVMLSLPAFDLQDDSQIFYGNLQEQGTVIWSLADDLEVDNSNQRLLLGHRLLLKECASCHNINLIHDMTGPALAWVTKRWKSMDDLIAFTKNSEGFAASGNLRAKAMVLWAPSAMIAFYHLSDEEIKAIYYYIDETARARKIDSTGQDTLSAAYFQASETFYLLYQVSSKLDQPFNWVNIDRYRSEDVPTQKDLKVKINENLDVHSTEVKIIFPNQNTIVSAYPNYKENYFSFTERYKLASRPFPIGEKAYLVATSVLEDDIYFAVKPITIGDNTLEELDLKLISKETLRQKIKGIF